MSDRLLALPALAAEIKVNNGSNLVVGGELTASMFMPHFFQLQVSHDLETWSNVGEMMGGATPSPVIQSNGSVLAVDGKACYRLVVSD